MQKITLDGQPLAVLNHQELQDALRTGGFEGRPFAGPKVVQALTRLISSHSELALALIRYRPDQPQWITFALLSRYGDTFRILLETRTCVQCGWKGYVGTVSPSDLYIQLPDKVAARNRAAALPAIGCPRCGTAIESGVVWVESHSLTGT